jgi:hypothetical protein
MRRTFVVVTVVAGLLTACVSQVPRVPPSEEQRPLAFPERFYLQGAERGQPVFQVEPALSLVVIEVRRAGSLAQLGHDHVVASHDVQGYIAPDDGRADLFVRLDTLVVDEPELRAQAAFDTQPSEAAIAGTRENMLAKLHAEQHPYALIYANSMDTDATDPQVNVAITLNGVIHETRIPLRIEKAGAQLNVTGRVALEQTNFGIVPFSILGGALQVQDRVDIRFVIRASRVSP